MQGAFGRQARAATQAFRNTSQSGAKLACKGNKAPPNARASEPMLPLSKRGGACNPSQLYAASACSVQAINSDSKAGATAPSITTAGRSKNATPDTTQ